MSTLEEAVMGFMARMGVTAADADGVVEGEAV
jgi:hypothetical protein